MKVITAKPMMLLPPAAGHCQQCAVKHDPAQPHNQQSLYWQFWFTMTYPELERSPTWADAMEHCTPTVRDHWITELIRLGQVFPQNHHEPVKRGDFIKPCYNWAGKCGIGSPARVVFLGDEGKTLYVRHRYGKVSKPVTNWIRVTP